MQTPDDDNPRDVMVTRTDYADGSLFPRHSHSSGQFAYAACGVITVETDAGNWVVPPERAIWVPADLAHAMQMRGPVTMLNTYIRPQAAQEVGLTGHSQVFGVSPGNCWTRPPRLPSVIRRKDAPAI